MADAKKKKGMVLIIGMGKPKKDDKEMKKAWDVLKASGRDSPVGGGKTKDSFSHGPGPRGFFGSPRASERVDRPREGPPMGTTGPVKPTGDIEWDEETAGEPEPEFDEDGIQQHALHQLRGGSPPPKEKPPEEQAFEHLKDDTIEDEEEEDWTEKTRAALNQFRQQNIHNEPMEGDMDMPMEQFLEENPDKDYTHHPMWNHPSLPPMAAHNMIVSLAAMSAQKAGKLDQWRQFVN